MKIMLDTNVILSVLLFPSQNMNRLIKIAAVKNTMVLSSYVIDELYKVINRKFPTKVNVIDELVYTPKNIKSNIKIRDIKDLLVIYTAIIENVDVLVTRDKDFTELEFEFLEILTPSEFVERYREDRFLKRVPKHSL